MFTKVLLLCLSLVVVPSLGADLPFIIGGSKVSSASDYPWQCSLQYNDDHICGASIISKDWLVTAAHCVESTTAGYSVRCGSLLWRSGTKYTLSKFIMHEDYETGDGFLPNDVAVIMVSTSMDLSGANMKAIPMASADQSGNPDCYITGWGYTKTGGGGKTPEDLMEAHIDVYTNEYCKGEWSEDDINEGHVCLGADGRGCCDGDSGGPAVCKVNGEFQLVGATSWGVVHCWTEYPSVYTRISYFRSWITAKTGVQ